MVPRCSEEGLSIIEILVAAALASGLAVFFAVLQASGMKGAKTVEASVDLSRIAGDVLLLANTPLACNPNTFKKPDGGVATMTLPGPVSIGAIHLGSAGALVKVGETAGTNVKIAKMELAQVPGTPVSEVSVGVDLGGVGRVMDGYRFLATLTLHFARQGRATYGVESQRKVIRLSLVTKRNGDESGILNNQILECSTGSAFGMVVNPPPPPPPPPEPPKFTSDPWDLTKCIKISWASSSPTRVCPGGHLMVGGIARTSDTGEWDKFYCCPAPGVPPLPATDSTDPMVVLTQPTGTQKLSSVPPRVSGTGSLRVTGTARDDLDPVVSGVKTVTISIIRGGGSWETIGSVSYPAGTASASFELLWGTGKYAPSGATITNCGCTLRAVVEDHNGNSATLLQSVDL